MNNIKKKIQDNLDSLGITAISVLLILVLDFLGIFQTLELKVFDYSFGIRGPMSGWMSYQDDKKVDSDIVLIELDDESYRLIPWTYPYPRGEVWTKIIENLSLAGAKVIVLDIMLDSPDQRSELLINYTQTKEFTLPNHGDDIFANMIRNIQERGTDVILASKRANEPTSIPPQYILLPNPRIMAANPLTGLTNVVEDKDGFMRRYYVFLPLDHEQDKLHLTMGMQAVHSYLDLPAGTILKGDAKAHNIEYGPLNIHTYGQTPTFLINYEGPPSGKMVPGRDKAWKTFPRYPLSNILDVEEITLSDPLEDTDWMDQFIGKVPEWITMLSDSTQKAEEVEVLLQQTQ